MADITFNHELFETGSRKFDDILEGCSYVNGKVRGFLTKHGIFTLFWRAEPILIIIASLIRLLKPTPSFIKIGRVGKVGFCGALQVRPNDPNFPARRRPGIVTDSLARLNYVLE